MQNGSPLPKRLGLSGGQRWLFFGTIAVLVWYIYIEREREEGQYPSLYAKKFSRLRTLVVGVGQMRGSIYAWNSLVSNLLYPFRADLALLLTNESEHSFLHTIAEYVWIEEELKDWGVIFSSASESCGKFSGDWEVLCEIPDQWSGGIAACNQPGSAGILLAFRLLMHKKIEELNLLSKYDIFIWTRLDELYLCEHFNFSDVPLHKNTLYLPKGERWGGWSDRHIVAAGPEFLRAISISNELVCSPEKWLKFFRTHKASYPINLEKLQALMWEELGLTVHELPRSMFTVKKPDDPTRWSQGVENSVLSQFNLLVKYPTEMEEAERGCNISLSSFASSYGKETSKVPVRNPVTSKLANLACEDTICLIKELPSPIQSLFTMDGHFPLQQDVRFRQEVGMVDSKQFPNQWSFQMKNDKIFWEQNAVDNLTFLASVQDISPVHYPYSAPGLQLCLSLLGLDHEQSKVAVFGSFSPWIEAILLANNFTDITTFDYQEIETNSQLKIAKMSDISLYYQSFDLVLSFSSIEHDGLGRYGDPIDPLGDVTALKEIAFVAKLSGKLLLGVPVGRRSAGLYYPFHRIYNSKRLKEITNGDWIYHGYVSVSELPVFRPSIDSVEMHHVLWQDNSNLSNWQNQPWLILSKRR